jgi:competence ComEA-like helix-hairpin-helix protein
MNDTCIRSRPASRVGRVRGLVHERVVAWARHAAPACGRRLVGAVAPIAAIIALLVAMGGSWQLAGAAPPTPAQSAAAKPPPERPPKKSARELTGKLNLNTATEEQLMMLPTIGPAKAERIVVWRKKNGGFRRTADLRRVKGFGYKTFKRLEPFLAVSGDSTLR